MKRTPKSIIVENYYTYFVWRPCTLCNDEFRRERGFKITAGHRLTDISYLCQSCAPNISEAEKIAKRLLNPPAPEVSKQPHIVFK